MFTAESSAPPPDLVTPTIKQDVYTTGRGGSGNMMHNDPDHPELARESQDVESPPLRVEEAAHHTGRGIFLPFLFPRFFPTLPMNHSKMDQLIMVSTGGAANMYIPSAEEEKRVREQEEQLRRVRTQEEQRLREQDEYLHRVKTESKERVIKEETETRDSSS